MQSRSPFDEVEHFAPPPSTKEADSPAPFADAGGRRSPVRRAWLTPFLSGAIVAAIVATSTMIVIGRDLSPPASPRPIAAQDDGQAFSVTSIDPVDRRLFGYRTPRPSDRRKPSRNPRRSGSHIRLQRVPTPPTGSRVAPGAGIVGTTMPPPPESKPRPRPKPAARPKPDRRLFHLYSQRLEDHLFTTDKSVVKRKDAWSYDIIAIEGLIFDSHVKGTKALSTSEGTVGYVWATRRDGALALYWFYGPQGEYFTTNDAMATELSDEPGWESRGIAGYVAPAS